MPSLFDTYDESNVEVPQVSSVVNGGTDSNNGFWDNIILTSNSFLSNITHPELQYRGEADPDWSMSSSDTFKNASPSERRAMMYARSETEASIMKDRYKASIQAEKELQEYSPLVTFPAQIATGILAPSTVVGGGIVGAGVKSANLGAKLFNVGSNLKQTSLITNVSAGLGFGASAGAVDQASGYRPDADPVSYGLVGMFLGGGITGIQNIMAKSTDPVATAKALTWTTEPPVADDVSKVFTSPIEAFAADPANIGLVRSKIQDIMPFKDFFLSAAQRVHASENPVANAIAQRLIPSVIGLRNRYTGAPMVGNKGNATAGDFKIRLDRYKNRVDQSFQSAYSKAKEKGFKGSMNAFGVEAKKAVNRAISKQLSGETVTRYHDNEGINEAVTAYFNYNKAMLQEGKNLNVYGVKSVDESKLYTPQMWDFDSISKMTERDVEDQLFNMMQAFENKLDIDKRHPEAFIRESAKQTAKTLKTQAINRETLDTSLIMPMMDTHIKNRSVNVDPAVENSLLDSNLFDSIGKYHYKQKGQYALNYAFPEFRGKSTSDLTASILDLYNQKPSSDRDIAAKELSDIKAMVQEILGTYRLPHQGGSMAWSAIKNMKGINSLVHGAGFVLNTAGELGVTVLSKGINGLFSTKFSALKDVQKALFRDGKLDTDLAQEMVDLGLLTDVVQLETMARYADVGGDFNVGKLEGALNHLNSGMYKWTGMRGTTAMLELMNGIGALNQIRKFGGKEALTDGQLMTLSRWGLTHNDAKAIKQAYAPYGKIEKLDLENMPDELVDKIRTAIIREAEMSVPKPGNMFAPDAVSKMNGTLSPIKALALQFLSYPLTANQTIFMRGLSEDKVGMAIGGTISLAAMSSVLYMREEAAIAVGAKKEIDRKYSLELGSEGFKTLMFEATGKNALVGMTATGLDFGLAFIGQEGLTSSRGYVSNDFYETFGGPTLGKIPGLYKSFHNLLNDEWEDEDWYNIKSVTPFSGIPILSEHLSTEIKY